MRGSSRTAPSQFNRRFRKCIRRDDEPNCLARLSGSIVVGCLVGNATTFCAWGIKCRLPKNLYIESLVVMSETTAQMRRTQPWTNRSGWSKSTATPRQAMPPRSTGANSSTFYFTRMCARTQQKRIHTQQWNVFTIARAPNERCRCVFIFVVRTREKNEDKRIMIEA